MKLRIHADWEAKQFFKEALELFGLDSQMDLVNEECAELIVALSHLVRGKVEKTSVFEEVADVLVMMGQMLTIVDEEDVNVIIDMKLERAAARLEKMKNERHGYSKYTESGRHQALDNRSNCKSPIDCRTHVQCRHDCESNCEEDERTG